MLRALVGAALAWVGCAGVAWAQDDRQDACGYVYPVQSYRADFGGLRLELTANDRLLVNGRVIAEQGIEEGRAPRPWGDSANSARVALTREYVLIQTFWTDCVDYASGRIYVLSRDGALIATSELWTMHDAWAGFSDARGELIYSSEWLCGEHSGAPAGRAYVYALRGGAFVREERGWRETCEAAPHQVQPRQKIYFALMQPVS